MFVNRRTVRIEWGDCDPAGIVYYPRYFQMFDASTQYLFEAAGWNVIEVKYGRKLHGATGGAAIRKWIVPAKVNWSVAGTFADGK